MDNFPGLFQDGDLGNLELDAESFTPQAPASLPVQEMDMSNFNQSSFPNIGNPGNPRTNSSPSGMGVQGTPQKMTHGAHASPGHTTMNNYASQNIQYSTGAPNQQVVGQYNANQFRQQYQGQNMYGQQPNPNMGDWNNASAPYTQVAGSYQQPQSQYPQQAMNSFQNQQTINTANFQATHHNMAQNYPAGSQGMAYQATNQPQFPGYEQQRPLGANSHINYNKANPMTNQSSQQYNVMQTPNQQYISQYSQNQVHLRPQHPSQIPPQTMVRGSGSQGELSLPSSPIPNGTAYRTPFPQVSPQMPNHAQGSPIPQSSPMPRSISPHTHSNTNLMNSPISSPASHPMSASISPNNSSVGSIQQLENMVKPNGTGVNVHMNSPNNISQTHSSNLYGNPVNIHGVVGQRGPVSPSIVNQPQINSGLHSQSQNQWPQNRTPQAYMPPNNINQGIASSTQIINSIPNTREQVASVSDKTVCLSDMSSAVGLGKGQVPCNANVNKMATSNISTESVNSVNLSGVGPNSRVEMSNSNSVTLVNGTISAPESVGDCNSSPNVPLSSLSTYGTTSPGVLSGSQAVPTANTLGLPSQMIPNPSAPPGSENGLPSTSLCNDITSSDSSVKLTQNAPSVTQSGNTLTLYSASHPEGQSTVVQQSFLLMDSAILDQNAESSDQVEKSSTTVQNTKINPADNISTSSDIAPLKNTVPTKTAISNDTSLNKNVSTSQLVTSSETPNPVISNQLSESPSKVMLASPDVQDAHSEIDDSVISSSQVEKSPVQMPTQALPDSQSEAPHSPTEDAESTITPQLNLSIDITKCRNEIQQLQNAPEDSETQQKMQELETKLAQLEAQQQKQQEQFLDGYSSRPSAEVDEKKPKKRGKPRTPKEPKTPRTPKPKREPKVKEPKESKPKREPKVKTPRTPKEPKPKKERTPRTPKEPKPKTPRERKKPVGKRSRKKAVTKPVVEGSGDAVEVMVAEGGVEGALFGPDGAPLLHTPIHASKLPSSSKSSRNEKRSKARGMFAAKKKTKLLVNPRLRKKPGSESDYSESEGVSVPKVEGVEDDENKRRSGRIQQGSRKKYVDELVLNLSDDDASKKDDADVYDDPFAHGSGQSYVMVNTNEEDSMPVQMILSTRRGEREVPVEATTPANPENEYTFTDEPPKAKSKSVKKIEVDEYFVKYKGLSYLHCSWGTEDELLKGDKRISGKIKRYRQKRAASQNIMDFLEEEPYNPDYIEIDRILDVMDYSEDEKPNKHFLVKWKSLPYDESTWEMEDDCEVDKIEAFYRHQKVPSKADLKYKKRPKSDEWKELSESPVYNNNNQLRGYQLEGVNWLTFSYYNGHNCILADEMGLGKTIQSLAFVQTVFNYGIRGPYLIIAPLSTIPNWQREFEGWTDLNVIVYHGSQSSRNMILEYEMAYKDENKEKIPNVYKFNVLITTFEVIIADNTELKEIEWRICIIDEAHRLKNRNCKLLEGLRIMHLDHRVLLSGTPLQNNVNELFSLLNFLEPTQFACQETFLHEFGNLQTEEQVKKLQALLKPMMLRRMKEDVEKSLAPKQETIIEVELTNIQKKYYRAILERNFDFLIKGATYTNVPSLMNTMMELRKCCLHPYLLNGAEDGIQQDYKDLNPESPDVYHSALIQSSGKMVLVDKLLPRLKANGHRVLVFSQMVKLLDIIEDYLIYRKYPYERLDGRIRGNLRQAAIDRFCKPDSDRFVFLLCTKAGGLGINLTAADTVIIYDSDWNPQNDLQAQARCHRIGQQKSVKIYRLLCNNTYEREMFDKASLKLGLDKAVLQSMNTEVKAAAGNSLGLSKKEVEDLLKKGAYGALMEDDNQGDKFCEEDIDQILSRRATVVTLESEKGSTFSKASFSSSDNRNDIDLADPDFWKKWAKKADIDVDSADKQLIMDEPRKRSAIRRYGHDESVLDCSDLDSSGSDSVAEQEQLDDATVEPGLRRTRRRRRNKGGREGKPSRSSKSGKSGGRWGADDEPADDDEVRYGLWHRSECFKVEKGLLTFGWGRWSEIMRHGEFRSAWTDSDVLACARMVLLYCIRYYRGDDKIKGFIFDLIAPSTDGKTRMHPNHIGLSAPVPRGRKGKKKLREAKLVATHMECAEWAKDEKFDCEKHLDQGYSRHLVRHANKVLLRVRLLFYIKQEIIGDHDAQINNGSHANELPIYPPPTELLPRPWWDNEADRNLLVGVYKHGYERYNVMRNDPSLCFLQRCGPPDAEALVAEMANNANVEEDNDKAGDDSDSNQMTPSSPAPSSATNKSEDDRRDASSGVATPSGQGNASALHQFPTPSDLNGRLRRLVTSYQRNNRKLEMRKEANIRGFDHYMADKMMRRERMAEYMRDRDLRKTDYSQRRWSNREQSEFYRTISTFGVEYIRKEKRYDWSKFRMLSRLEKRLDENLTEYFRAFMAMCKRQCGIRLTEQENAKILEIGVDRLPEERARRVLERVDMLNRLRNDVLTHSEVHKALELALPSKDMPDWWIPGKHDLDLLRGVARHGMGRTDYYILYDPDLCFREILRRHTAGEPLITTEEKAELNRKYYNDAKIADEGQDSENEGVENAESKAENENTETETDKVESEEKDSADISEEAKAPEITEEESSQNSSEEIPKSEEIKMEVESKAEPTSQDANGEQKSEVKAESVKDEADVKPALEKDVKSEEDLESSVKAEREESKVETVKEEKNAQVDETEVKSEKADLKETKQEPDTQMEESNEESKKAAEPVEEESSEKADATSETKVTKAMPGLKGIPTPPLLSLQQMDEAMSKIGVSGQIDPTVLNEPTVAQLLAQSAANPIKWPKDRYLQIRLEHIMYAVEHKRWPVPLDYQTVEYDFSSGGSKCDTPPSAPSTPTGHQHHAQEIYMMEAERKRRRQIEEVERAAHLQAMLHPNLHHNLGLSKVQAALGLNANSFAPNLRTLMEASEHDKKTQQLLSDSHTHALRQLQALQGSLDLTIKPVSSQAMEIGGVQLLSRRGPGRPRLDESMLKASPTGDKRRQCDSPQDGRKRRKLDDIVLGLTSKSGKFPDLADISVRDSHTLSLLRSPSVSIITSKDRTSVTPSINTPKLSSSISITPTSLNKLAAESRKDTRSPSKHSEKESSKPGLVKSSDLPPGISLPPGIELYRPADSTKVDKWLEQHQDLLGEIKSREPKRRKVDLTSLDWSKFSGDEVVPLVNSSNGHTLSSSDCPKLKYLAQWLMEHPGYEVDPRWVESNKDILTSKVSSELHNRLTNSHDKKSTRQPSTSSGSSRSGLDAKRLQGLLDLKNPLALAALSTLDPKILAGLDPKKLAGIDPKLLAGLDPKHLLGSIDAKTLGIDPKHPAFDPKILSAMGIDPKLLGIDVSKHQETKVERKPSPAQSPCSSTKSNESKPSTSHGIDPKLLAGLDPKLLGGLDPKLLQALDPKVLGLDPKMLASLDPKALAGLDLKALGLDPKQLMGGIDPKLLSALGGGVDPKLLASLGGMDPMMMMAAGFGGLPNMAGLGLANPFLAGLSGFNLGGMPNVSTSSSSKDNQRQAAAAAALAANQANLFAGMFGGAAAAGLMYPPLGLGALNPFQLPQMSAAQSSALLNGFATPVTSVSATPRSNSSYSKRQTEKERLRQEAEREREIVAARKEKIKESMKVGMSKEDKTLKQSKAERLARVDPRTTVQSHEIFLANHLSQLGSFGQIDLSIRPVTSSSKSSKSNSERTTPVSPSKGSEEAEPSAPDPVVPTKQSEPEAEPDEQESVPEPEEKEEAEENDS